MIFMSADSENIMHGLRKPVWAGGIKANKEKCEWGMDLRGKLNTRNTGCGVAHYEGEGIKNVPYKFCPYCGRAIDIKL
jgi:hypothetical protein